MLFSCKIHINTSPVPLLSSALPPIILSLCLSLFFPLVCDIWYQRGLVETKLSFTISAFAFFLPKLRTLNAQALLCGQGTCRCVVTTASQMRSSPIRGSACFGPSPETDPSGSPLTLSIHFKTPTGAAWVKRASFKYPNIVPQLLALFGMLEPSFLGQKFSVSICS